MLFSVWIKLNDVQKRISFKKYYVFLLCPKNVFPRLKILGIPSYGHFETITWSLNLGVNKMAVFKVEYWRGGV